MFTKNRGSISAAWPWSAYFSATFSDETTTGDPCDTAFSQTRPCRRRHLALEAVPAAFTGSAQDTGRDVLRPRRNGRPLRLHRRAADIGQDCADGGGRGPASHRPRSPHLRLE